MTILGILQFLSQIHPWVCMTSQTTDRVNGKEGVEVARGRKECLQQTQKQDNESFNTSHFLPQMKDATRDQHLRICHRRGIVTTTRRYFLKTRRLSIQGNE